jgi:hypothetical protein
LKLEGHALTQEIHTKTLRLEGDSLVTMWEDFKTLIKSQFYPIEYVKDQWIRWHYFKQRQGQSVQEYTSEFRKMKIMLGISPKNPDVLLKYIGDLHSHPQGGFTQSSMKACDALQSKDSGRGMCTSTVPRKHRPREGATKWFKAERALGSFQGGEEEVEKGKR